MAIQVWPPEQMGSDITINNSKVTLNVLAPFVELQWKGQNLRKSPIKSALISSNNWNFIVYVRSIMSRIMLTILLALQSDCHQCHVEIIWWKGWVGQSITAIMTEQTIIILPQHHYYHTLNNT